MRTPHCEATPGSIPWFCWTFGWVLDLRVNPGPLGGCSTSGWVQGLQVGLCKGLQEGVRPRYPHKPGSTATPFLLQQPRSANAPSLYVSWGTSSPPPWISPPSAAVFLRESAVPGTSASVQRNHVEPITTIASNYLIYSVHAPATLAISAGTLVLSVDWTSIGLKLQGLRQICTAAVCGCSGRILSLLQPPRGLLGRSLTPP